MQKQTEGCSGLDCFPYTNADRTGELHPCAEWGEITSERKGYRNGSYTRDLVTKTGRIEDLSVPRDREGVFHSQTFERYSRYEPEVAEALTEMFVSGTRTHKVVCFDLHLLAWPARKHIRRAVERLTVILWSSYKVCAASANAHDAQTRRAGSRRRGG